MKAYMVFAGNENEAKGGWADFNAEFDTELEALGYTDTLHDKDMWTEIIRTKDGSRVE